MFPPVVDSFGNQLTAVMINLVGTVLGAVFTTIVGAFTNNIIAPLFKSIAIALGIPA